MSTISKSSVYEAPQAELLPVFTERNFMVSETAEGQDVTWSDKEEDFDDFFNN